VCVCVCVCVCVRVCVCACAQFVARQCTATCCNTLQNNTARYHTLQHTATHCNTLQHTATHCIIAGTYSCLSQSHHRPCPAQYCMTSCRHTATHCNILQNTATHCNTLQNSRHEFTAFVQKEVVVHLQANTVQLPAVHTAPHRNTL